MKNIKKITSILIVASVTMVLFSGCGSKTASTTSAKADTTSARTDNRKFDPTAMKTLYTTILKDLVTDKTVTQTQSDKVLEVVTKDMPTDGAKTGGTAPTSGTKPSGTPPTDGDKGTRTKNDRLSELVTSKVITQAQADTINQKFQGAMKNSQSTTTK